MVYMTAYIKIKSTAGKIFLLSILLLVLAIILSIISMYSYAFEEKIYSKSLIVINSTTLELLGNIPYATYQLKLVVNVGNPPVDFVVKDCEGFIIYHQKLTNTQNLFSISPRELSTLTISCNASASVAIEIYALHVRKPLIILAVLSLALFIIGFPLSFTSFLYICLGKANE